MDYFMKLPVFLILKICSYIDDMQVLNVEQTCKKLKEILNRPIHYKRRCLERYGKRFERGLNKICTMDEEELNWKQKYFLSKHFPSAFKSNFLGKEVDSKCPLIITNKQNDSLNVLSDHPFITCNPILLSYLPAGISQKFHFVGFEYFEMKVLSYKYSFNQAVGKKNLKIIKKKKKKK